MLYLRKYICLSAVICLLSAVSCSKVNPAYNRENIKGMWIVNTIDGSVLSDRDCFFMQFDESGSLVYSGIAVTDTGHVWSSNRLSYEVYCCDLTVKGQFSGLFGNYEPLAVEYVYDFVSHEDSSLVLGVRSFSVNGKEAQSEFTTLGMEKLHSSYAAVDSISGIWQFNTKNEEAFQDYRLQFKDDGALVFYTRTGENDWTKGNATDRYYKYSDFLAMVLYDNSVFGMPDVWETACFRIETASRKTNRLILIAGEDRYVLSFISSN